jgi:hypothetical protein
MVKMRISRVESRFAVGAVVKDAHLLFDVAPKSLRLRSNLQFVRRRPCPYFLKLVFILQQVRLAFADFRIDLVKRKFVKEDP